VGHVRKLLAARTRRRGEVSMTTPTRVQLRRIKGWRKPEGAISVARPHKWGNPYVVGMDAVDAADAVRLYRQWLPGAPVLADCR
jgi:hypothetical protein